MSTFGSLFRVHTFGESHCKAVGVIIDGCPPGLPLATTDIQPQLSRRRPGQSILTTQRQESDTVSILSGVELGYTLGTPIAMTVNNLDQRPHDYSSIDLFPRPSHADFTYLSKYGIKASSGGGRSSARETIARVAASAVAEKFLSLVYNIEVVAFVSSVGSISMFNIDTNINISAEGTNIKDTIVTCAEGTSNNTSAEGTSTSSTTQDTTSTTKDTKDTLKDGWRDWWKFLGTVTREQVDGNEVRCPDPVYASKMRARILEAKEDNNSIGGIITCVIRNLPPGLGEPCFDKFEAKMAHAMLSIPATKGFEFGSGFAGTRIPGDIHNDSFYNDHGKLRTTTNFSGGVQGGITNGEHVYFNVAFKSVATIGKAQGTATYAGEDGIFEAKGRHDPCVLPRCSPIVESMATLVVMDMVLLQQARQGVAAMLSKDNVPPVMLGKLDLNQ